MNVKKKFYATALIGLLALSGAVAMYGQNPFGTNMPATLSSGDIAFARAFSFWQGGSGVMVTQGNGATGASTLTVAQCQITVGGGVPVSPFNTNAPITVLDGTNNETVTPTAVSPVNVGNGCQITASFTYVHGTGAMIISGTYGLQEAINFIHTSQNGGIVIVSSNFPGSVSMITGAAGFVDTQIQWNHSGYPQYYVWNGANYVLNPSANLATVNLVNPTALTTLMSQTQAAGQQNSVGRTVHIDADGFLTTGASSTVRLYLLIGPTANAVPGCDITSAATGAIVTNYPWKLSADIITNATGTGGTLEVHCGERIATAVSGTTATTSTFDDANVTAFTQDLTQANTIAIQGMFGTSNASNRLAQRVLQISYKN